MVIRKKYTFIVVFETKEIFFYVLLSLLIVN